jgi:hypothetical protein
MAQAAERILGQATDRETALLAKFKPPELRDLHPELYAAIVREAQRIAAFEWRRWHVENSIKRARAAIEAGSFPREWSKGYRTYEYDGKGRKVWHEQPGHFALYLHEPVVCTWLVDTTADENGLAPLDAIYKLATDQDDWLERDYAMNAVARGGMIGALRSNSCTGLIERAYPRIWRLTDLGRELMEVVFDA